MSRLSRKCVRVSRASGVQGFFRASNRRFLIVCVARFWIYLSYSLKNVKSKIYYYTVFTNMCDPNTKRDNRSLGLALGATVQLELALDCALAMLKKLKMQLKTELLKRACVSVL